MRALIGSICDTFQRAGATDKISERPCIGTGPNSLQLRHLSISEK